MQKRFCKLAAAIAVVGFCSAVQAAPFSNGGFDDKVFDVLHVELKAGDTRLSPWQVTKGGIEIIGTHWETDKGAHSLDLISGQTNVGEISQTFDTIPDKKYLVQFKMSGNPVGGDPVKVIDVSVTNSNIGSLHYEYSTATNKTTLDNMNWKAHSFEFTAQSNSATLIFTGTTKSGSVTSYGPTLDSVSVTEIGDNNGMCCCQCNK